MSKFIIKNLVVSVDGREVVSGIDLELNSGQVHVLMGPNGAGKSSLAYALAGHPNYQVTGGSVKLDGQDLLKISPNQRSQAGLFLAFQHPVEVPGVKVRQFLWQAYKLRSGNKKQKRISSILKFRKHLEKLADQLQIDKDLLTRGLNEGFSGGEKKRLEFLQMMVLEPKFVILDEPDSGLDADGVEAVALGVKKLIKNHHTGVLLITHYRRVLKFLEVDEQWEIKGGKISH